VGKGSLPASPTIRQTVRDGRLSLCRLSLSTVNCPAAARQLSPGGCTAKREFLFLREQHGNVYENKGSMSMMEWRSGNVYENKGSYASKAGMYMKTCRLMFSAEIDQVVIYDRKSKSRLAQSSSRRGLDCRFRGNDRRFERHPIPNDTNTPPPSWLHSSKHCGL